ncbi:MAG TPA: phage terminase large subunit family protein [Verrucomicrobiae bacterium]|nr:phage terminase large subunit family protein [Verrucomicrobiae bacterium]
MATAIINDRPETIYSAVDQPFESALRPDPDITVDEWADEYRVLSRVSAGEPGRWRTSRTPFLREIMECLSPSSPFSRVIFVKPAQIGGSEVLLNFLGYIIHFAPGPVMLVQPTVELAKRFSRQRIAPLIETTRVLAERVSDPRERDSGNTILAKEFPGGVLVATGANSAVGLRSMPARYLLMDEVDAYPASASSGGAGTEEGDPVDLAIRRTGTFANKQIAMISTPTVADASRIDAAYHESDQRKYYVPCPHCGAFQVFRWAQVKWPPQRPAEAWYECDTCHQHIADHHKQDMLARGRWRADASGDGETAGFWLNALYSPWTTWSGLAKDFLRARKSPERMQTFANTVLAETYQQAGTSKTDASELLARRQAYHPDVKLPAGVALITLGADVQADRLELEIVGWGRNEESWSLAYIVLPGDPAQRDLWDAFDQALSLRFEHPCGRELEIAVACVDSGFHQSLVQAFCMERQRRAAAPRMYPIKGAAGQRPIWPRMFTKAKDSRPLWVIGVDAAKEALYARLKIAEPGPGYCHFPASDQYDLGYFEQLTAETCRVRYHKGFAQREWTKKPGARNEALDARCYAYAALQSLITGRFRLNKQADQIEAMLPKAVDEAEVADVGDQFVPPPAEQIDRRDWFTR